MREVQILASGGVLNVRRSETGCGTTKQMDFWRRRPSRKEVYMVLCVVCKVEVEEKKARGTSVFKDKTYYFDSKACKKQFDESPEQFEEK